MQAEDYDGRTRPAQWMTLCFFVRANPFSPTRWHARNFKRRTLAPQHKPLRHLRQVGTGSDSDPRRMAGFTTAVCRKGI